MVAAWTSLDNRPVGPAPAGDRQDRLRRTSSLSWSEGQPVRAPTGLSGSRLEEGTHGGSSGQGQREHGGAQLSADRRGGRDSVCVAQDRVPLGQGGRAALLPLAGKATAALLAAARCARVGVEPSHSITSRGAPVQPVPTGPILAAHVGGSVCPVRF